MEFTKQALDTADLIALLRARGLYIEDEGRLAYYLKSIGYYRLSGYMYPLQERGGSHKFHPNTNFEKVLEHYRFDKKLRFLVLDAIERIEISLRAGLTNVLSVAHGSHWYLNDNLFTSKTRIEELRIAIRNTCAKANEIFIIAYLNKYTKPELPPVWMVLETLTLGNLVNLFENLKDCKEKRELCNNFNVVEPILVSWLKSLNFVRNCCAHHARLWNRKLPIKPTIPVRKCKKILQEVDDDTDKRLFGILSCTVHLLACINPSNGFKEKFFQLLQDFPNVNTSWMGFPANWKNEQLWK